MLRGGRPLRNALISQGRYLKSGTNSYMKDPVGGNQRRARFQALCQSLRPGLLRFAFWLARDRALAEDVVQETMIRAWKAQDSLLDEGAAKPWFLTIIRREYARSFERKRFVTVDVEELIAKEEPIRMPTGPKGGLDPWLAQARNNRADSYVSRAVAAGPLRRDRSLFRLGPDH